MNEIDDLLADLSGCVVDADGSIPDGYVDTELAIPLIQNYRRKVLWDAIQLVCTPCRLGSPTFTNSMGMVCHALPDGGDRLCSGAEIWGVYDV